MATKSKVRRLTRTIAKRVIPHSPPVEHNVLEHSLLEQSFPAATTTNSPPLKIDRDKGIIFGVKVLGRFSKNVYDQRSEGTEYSPACMDDAVRRGLFEGQKVKTNHPPDRTKPGAERDVQESLGILRGVRREVGRDGEPGLYADLHYLKAHPLAESVCEDVERGLGVYGLSQNAISDRDRERLDPVSKRLVIESLAAVRSVDLVDKPATNRNLWESETVSATSAATKKITMRSLLESQKKRFSKARWSWANDLLENAMCEDEMDVPEAAVAPESDPDDAMWVGFSSAIDAVLQKYKGGELDDKSATKEIAKYLKAHSNLTAEDEPESVEESEDDEEDKGNKKKPDDDKVESIKAENDKLKKEAACRDLCETEQFFPSKTQLKSLVLLESDAERRELIGSLKKGTTEDKKRPKSYAPTNGKAAGSGNRNVNESEVDVDSAAALLCGK